MPEFAVARPLAESDLRDEFGLDPVRALPPYRRSGEGLRSADQGVQADPQFGERALVVTGAHLAGIAQGVPAVVIADKQRAEAAPAAGGGGEAADYHLPFG